MDPVWSVLSKSCTDPFANNSANSFIIGQESLIASEGSATRQTGCRRIKDPDEELRAKESDRDRPVRGDSQ